MHKADHPKRTENVSQALQTKVTAAMSLEGSRKGGTKAWQASTAPAACTIASTKATAWAAGDTGNEAGCLTAAVRMIDWAAGRTGAGVGAGGLTVAVRKIDWAAGDTRAGVEAGGLTAAVTKIG